MDLYELAQTSILIDWFTTLDLINHYSEGYYETNRFLGPHPDRGEINTYFLLQFPVNYLANTLPEPVRSGGLVFRIWDFTAHGIHNLSIGLSLRLPWY